MASVLSEPVSRPGWQAELDLEFERHGARTAMTLNRHRGPLQVQKALYPEGGKTCHISVLHPPGGIAAGDQLDLRVALHRQAQALLTTPGATKWYRSESVGAVQRLQFSLAEDSALEWLPRENILFEGCDVSLELDVELAVNARYLGWDIYCFGRRASGEAWKRGHLRMRSRVRSGNRLLWSEVANLAAGGRFAASPVGLAGFSVSGTFLAANCGAQNWLQALRALPAPSKSRVGITALPDLVIARYLGDCSEAAFAWYTALWTLLRPHAVGKVARPPRVWAC